MQQLAKYGLTLPISLTTTHSWMIKLRCKYDWHQQSFFVDGHQRPDGIEDFHKYLRLKKQLALQQPR